MASIVDSIRTEFGRANWLNRLLYINMGVFILIMIARLVVGLIIAPEEPLLAIRPFLALPSELGDFARHPWTLFTYMFVHFDFFHILMNMLMLYFLGRIFIEFMGDKRILPVYIYGGIAGGLLFVLLYNISPAFTVKNPLIGASAGVMAVVVAIATKVPQLPVRLIFFEVKLWMVAGILVLIDLANFWDGNTGGHIAHLGGVAVGYFYVRALENGRDWSNGFWNLIRRLSSIFERKPKLRTVHKKSYDQRSSRRSTASKAAQSGGNDQKRMDEILDKIKDHGYDKLSKEEKDFLFQFSKK
ncbi:MAG: rhomboid family intramembrane serine protease [Flavobacteriia bacterium]|nr:rhomboid family intramembrane serine protease [Flavobacteriia bacterium]